MLLSASSVTQATSVFLALKVVHLAPDAVAVGFTTGSSVGVSTIGSSVGAVSSVGDASVGCRTAVGLLGTSVAGRVPPPREQARPARVRTRITFNRRKRVMQVSFVV